MGIIMDTLRNNKFFIIVMVLLIYICSRKHLYNDSSDTWIMPVEGVITQEFKGDKHHGIDIGCGTTSIHASNDGIVSFSGWKGVYGNCIMILHNNNVETLYGHNSENLVEVGDKVKQGDVIANSGNSGRSFGIHCHFEYRKGGICYNPMDFVNKNLDIIKSYKMDDVSDFDANKYLPQNIDEFKDE